MRENKFENQVHKQMEGFRLRPSDEVWQKVEEELRKKKKRRVVFYIFFLAGGLSLLGYSGYFVFNKSKSTFVQQNSTLEATGDSIENNASPVSVDKNSSVNKQQPVNDQSVFESDNNIGTDEKPGSTEPGTISRAVKAPGGEKDVIVKESQLKQRERKSKKLLNKEIANYKTESVIVKNENAQVRGSVNWQRKTSIENATQDKVTQPVGEQKVSVDEKKTAVASEDIQPKKDSVSEEIALTKDDLPAAQQGNSVLKERKRMLKISWGIELAGGASSNRESVLSFSGSQKSMMADNAYSPPLNSPVTGNAVVHTPSSIKSGPSFRAGIVAEIQLSRKSRVSSGLRYAYFSNSMTVGAYKDTVIAFSNSYSQSVRVDAIYRGFHQVEYTNRFHFIQLPLQYHLQLNKGVKLPITWDIGGSIGYLAATNGLVYDTTASGIYYNDDDAFNKLHWNLNTGFSFKFGNKRKIQWSLGPELSLGMNKLTKDDNNRNQFLLYGGLTGRLIFAKKK
jgi:hypothetical protein